MHYIIDIIYSNKNNTVTYVHIIFFNWFNLRNSKNRNFNFKNILYIQIYTL